MLTKLIVTLYSWIVEVVLWLMLALSGIVGYHVTVPLMMNATGWMFENELAWKVFGALVFVVSTFLVLAVMTGPFLILVDIRKAVRNIEARSERGEDGHKPLASERRQPSL